MQPICLGLTLRLPYSYRYSRIALLDITRCTLVVTVTILTYKSASGNLSSLAGTQACSHLTGPHSVLAVAMRGRCNGIERRAGLLLCWRWLCRRRSSAFSFWFRRAFSRVGLRHEHTHSNSQAQGSSEIDCGTTPRNAGVITSGDEWHGD